MGLETPMYGDIQAAGFQFFFVPEGCFFNTRTLPNRTKTVF